MTKVKDGEDINIMTIYKFSSERFILLVFTISVLGKTIKYYNIALFTKAGKYADVNDHFVDNIFVIDLWNGKDSLNSKMFLP